MTSTVKKWMDAKGYGFIRNPDASGGDIFVHCSKVLGQGHKTLTPGERVQFETFTNEKGRTEAKNVVKA